MIQINPLKSYIDGGVRAAITTPPSASLVFDLPGKAIWVKGVKLKGTDHTYTFSHDNYITLTNTSNSNESEDIKIGVNTSALKNAIDTTYGVVSTTTNGLAPKFTSENKQAASAATTYYFLGWTGSTLKWYQAPFRNVRINSETTDRLGINNTDPLIISSGNGISVTWDSTNKKIIITNTKPDVNHNTHYTTMLYIGENNDTKANKNVANPYLKLFDDSIRRATFQIKAGSGIAVTSDTNGNITITNSSPDVNHNTDRTGIKLTTVSGTKKTDSTLILANSTSGLNIQGGTNKFLIGDGTNYIEVPVVSSVSNKDATIGTALTTIATISGIDIKAKIASYSLSNHTHLVKINGSTKTIAASGAVDLGNYLPLSGGIMGGTAWIIWSDSGNWSNNNSGVTFPVIRGGLQWSGQSDYVKLFTEETSNDNLNLILQFGDDNSNGLSIRDKSNVQTSYISSGGVITTGTFKGNLDWSYITNKPSSYTPSAHAHAWNSLTHSSTTENQAILTNGSANGWKLYTLNISGWNNAANNAHSHSNKSVLDGITSTLVNNWNTAYTFVNTITGTDTDKVINKWDEIVNFLAGITEDNKLNTLLNSKLSVYELADNTNVGAIKNNGIYYSTSDSSSGTLLNSPFSNSFTLINMISYDGGDDLRRSRLAFNAYGEVKVSNDRGQANTAETWYNVLTSNNSGISGSTIKLNGTSITVYSSSTADSRFVKKTGDTMSGVLTIDTTGFGALTIKRNDDTNGASIQFRGKSSVYGYIGLNNSTKDKQFLRWNSDTSKTYTILDTSSTYTSNGKGVINGTTITQVDNATNAINSTNSTNSTNARKLVNWYSTRPTSLNTQFGDGSLRIFYATSSTTEGKSPDDATILHLSWDNNGGWDTQLGINSPSGRVYSRAQNSGTWQPWKTLAFTTDIPSSLKNPYSLNVFGVTYDGSAAKVVSPSNFISQVTEGTSTVTDGTMFITSYASNSGFADTNAVNVPYKRKAILLWEYIKVKTDSLYATKSHNHDDRYVRAFGTSNDNIDSDWGQSFKTFDPIPSGTPPEQNPNISILNIGNNFNRRKQLAFIYNNDNIYYRRHVDSGFTNWRRIAFANEIPTSLKNPHALTISLNGTSQGPYDGSAAKSINITPGSIGAATSGHNHDSYYVKYGKVVKSTTDNANVTPYLYNVENEEVISGYYKYWYIFNMGQYSGGNFGTQIAMPYQDSLADSELFIRSANNGSWRTWRRVLHSNNYASILDSRYYTKSEVNNLLSNKLNISNFNWTNLSGKIVAGNEFNIVNAGFNNRMWFNYLPINDRSKTATILDYVFGNGHQGYATVTASGFVKNGSSSSYVLLGDGGHKVISDFATSGHTHSIYAANENYGGFTKSGRLPISGFYQSCESESGGNAPWTSWMHLINCQHNNGGNNYALQIAASFYDNNIFKIRVTNGNVNNAWRNIIHSGNIGSQSVASATRLQTARNLWGNSFNGTADISGTIRFNNVTSGLCEGIQWTCGDNDFARIKAGATGSDAGYLEIATADGGNEPIYVRQYSGVFSTLVRTLTLLDGSGNTIFPGSLSIGGNIIFPNSSHLLWNSGSWYQRILLNDDSTADTSVFTFQQSSDSGTNWSNLMTIRDNGKVIANTFVGNLQGNAATATKLQTARKIWGQSFDGTRDVSGSLSGVGHIQFSADNSYSIGTTTSEAAHTYTRQVWTRHLNASRVYTGDTNLYIGYNNTAQVKFYSGTKQSGDGSNERMTISTNGNVGIGTTSPTYKLHVVGDIYTTTGFKKNGSSDSYVLLGGGGHKLESSLNVAYSKYLTGITLTGGNGNNEGYRLIFERTMGGWTINCGVWAIAFRHSGRGTLNIGFDTTNQDGSSYTYDIKFLGSTASKESIPFRAFYNTTTKVFRIYWHYYDYTSGEIAVLRGNMEPYNGTWITSLPNDVGTELTITYNTADYATNADTVDGYHASAFATSGHTHSYLPLSGGTITGNIILKGGTSADMTYAGNVHPYIRFDNSDSSQNISLIFTDYDSYRRPAGIKLIGNQGNEWFEATNIYATTFYGALQGNASTATTLQTARTLWGQSFNGSSNVSGSISGTYFHIEDRASNPYFQFIDSSNQIGYFQLLPQNKGIAIGSTGSKSLIVNPSGNVGIGITNPLYKLTVNGVGNDKSPVQLVNASRNDTWVYNASFLAPNLTSNHNNAIFIGKAHSICNAFGLTHMHIGDSSVNNYAALEVYGVGNVQRWYYDRHSSFLHRADFSSLGSDASYMNSALQIREHGYNGTQADTWANAPRMSWHWSGRVQTQIGLCSNNELYLSKNNFGNAYRLVYETGTWNISITGNASTATNADTLDGYHLSTIVDRSGENLIIGTTHASIIGWNQNGWSGGISTYDENNGIYNMWSNNGWHTLYYTLDSQYASKAISFSFDIMFVSSESTEGPVSVYVGPSSSYLGSSDYHPSISDLWEHKKGTFTLGSTPIFGIMIRGTDNSGKVCIYRIKNLKVELGDLPTIWTPAHADISWDNLIGKPSSFTPSSHTHTISDIIDIGNASVNYANSAGNADKVDGQHFNWNNNKNDHTYLWAASDNGNAYLVHRASISVNYATYARYVYCTSGNYLNFQWSGQNDQPTWLWGSNDGANCYVWNPSNFSVYKANKSDQLEAYTSWGFTDPGRFVRAIRYNGWHTRLYMGYYRDATLENTVHVGYADDADTLDGNHASAFALVGHTHNYDNVYSKLGHTHDDRYYTESEINSKLSAYLPLAGGTMTGQIKGNNKGGSWIQGRANAALYQPRNVQDDWHPVIGFKTKTGSWEFGSVGSDDFATFSWGSDSNYNSGTNTTTVVYLRNTRGTIALTSEIPTVTNYYWANMKVSSTSSTSTSPTFSTCYTSNWFRSTGQTGWYNETYKGGWYMTDTTWVRTYNSKGIFTNTGTIYNLGHAHLACNSDSKVGIGTTSPSYKLHVSGDSYATGWSRAASGFYCQDTGVHFTHNGTKGQIAMTSNNEFCWGANSNILYFNYAASSYGTTVTQYVWNAGSSSSYASHTMGHITLGNGNYQLKRVGSASSWYNGRDKAIVRQTSNAGDYCVIMSSKTANGSWEIGNDETDLCFTYITDSNYNNRNNNNPLQIWFTYEGIIHTSNYIYAAHFYENSDVRYKKILKNLSINSNTIANLPLFDFEWIENNSIGTGTSAQAVQQILPNLVSGTDKLTLDYGVLGTIAGITACKELVMQKSELQQLKEKVKQLEDKLRKYENI